MTMSASIHLGFTVEDRAKGYPGGEPISIPVRHMAITGQTQESGKTTTLEAAIDRSGLRAVAYVTKRGESSFHVANPIPPYFQERADWKFVQSMLEASTETKLKFEQSWIMRASEGAKTLEDVRANIHKYISGVRDPRPVKHRRGTEVKDRWLLKPARGLNGDMYYLLSKYLDDIMPQLAALPYSTKLELTSGLNVMDLRDYDFPLQALVIRSVIDWVHDHGKKTINVIPEAWKFAPKQKGSPVRQSAEEMIREGGALENFLWIDSQDLAGVADVLMRQVGVWIFGVQRAKHEIERALDHMPEGLPVRRPRPQDIATLSKGQFYVCFAREMYKVYVQPAWMTAAHAEAIARGEEDVESAREILKQYAKETKASRFAALRAKVVSSQNSVAYGPVTEEKGIPQYKYPENLLKPIFEAEEAEEETMWKEKHDAVKQELETALAQITRLEKELERQLRPVNRQIAATGNEDVLRFGTDLETIYAFVKERASRDPGVLTALSERPQLHLKVSRPVLSIDGNSLFGRMAQLITEGFFKAPAGAKAATAEAVRRGWCHRKTPFMRAQKELDELSGMGFLTRETDGYQAVAGAKIKLEEVEA